MNIICYSKNRACQLDLLLRSMEKCFSEDISKSSLITIIYAWSYMDTEYFYGYHHKLRARRSGCLDPLFIVENDFRADVLDAISPRMPLTMFFVDDNVMINKLDFHCPEFDYLLNHDDVVALSTRMYPGITYSYSNNVEMSVPEFEYVPLRWQWKGLTADWGYPMCMGDGNIYRTEDILTLLHSVKFRNPYELEQRCAEKPINKPYMVCFNEAKVLGVPNNIVQEWHKNRHGHGSVRQLNNLWLAGNQISLNNFMNIKTHSPHAEVEYKMEAAC